MFDLTFQMGWIGGGILVLGALVIGIGAQFIGTPGWAYEWVVTGVAALVAGFIGSEYLGDLSTWGPNLDGLFATSAVVPAIVVGGLAAVVVRFLAALTETSGRTA